MASQHSLTGRPWDTGRACVTQEGTQGCRPGAPASRSINRQMTRSVEPAHRPAQSHSRRSCREAALERCPTERLRPQGAWREQLLPAPDGRPCGRLTLLCAYTTEPRSFQVPPRRSMRIILRICRNRRLRSADVAKTLPWEPAASTAMDAMSTMMSVGVAELQQGRQAGRQAAHGMALLSPSPASRHPCHTNANS